MRALEPIIAVGFKITPAVFRALSWGTGSQLSKLCDQLSEPRHFGTSDPASIVSVVNWLLRRLQCNDVPRETKLRSQYGFGYGFTASKRVRTRRNASVCENADLR